MQTTPPTRRRRVLRAIGIAAAVLLLLFAELVRESYVLDVNKPASGASLTLIGKPSEGWVSASGQWFATAGSDRLVPNTVRIECRTELNVCAESSATLFKELDSVSIDTTFFTPSQMNDDAVVYENTTPLCVTYQVRIDLAQQRVLSTRTKKANAPADCGEMSERLTMELGDAFRTENIDRSWEKEHFVPLVRLLQAFL